MKDRTKINIFCSMFLTIGFSLIWWFTTYGEEIYNNLSQSPLETMTTYETTWMEVVTTDMLPTEESKSGQILDWDPNHKKFVWTYSCRDNNAIAKSDEEGNVFCSQDSIDVDDVDYTTSTDIWDEASGGDLTISVDLTYTLRLGNTDQGVMLMVNDDGKLTVNGHPILVEGDIPLGMIPLFSLGAAVRIMGCLLLAVIPGYLIFRDTQERRRRFWLDLKKIELQELEVSDKIIRRNA